jgi:hypothetical protein
MAAAHLRECSNVELKPALIIDYTLGTCPEQPYTPQHVGGEVFSANKLTVLSPYLALITLVAVAVVVVRSRRTKAFFFLFVSQSRSAGVSSGHKSYLSD